MGPRLWERRPRDDDFGTVRLGTGVQKLAIQLIPPDSKPVEDLDALSAGALRRFVRAHSTVCRAAGRRRAATPSPGSTSPATRGAVRDLVRAMIAQLTVFHSPDDMRIMVCAEQGVDAALGVGQVAAARPAPRARPTPPGRSG